MRTTVSTPQILHLLEYIMCTGLFSCMDQKHVVVRKHLARLERLLESDDRDERTASTVLSVADTLANVMDDAPEDADPDPGAELRRATSALYDAAGRLFDEPTSAQRWQKVQQHHRHTREIFDREYERLQRECGAAGFPVS